MGGKLFEAEGAVRISTQEYKEKYVPALTAVLAPLQLRFDFIQFYENKPDQGNINILVNQSTILPTNIANAIVDLNPNRKEVVLKFLREQGYKVKTNSNIISFLYDDRLQVDLVFTKTSLYDYSLNYYSFNDLGGLIGRLSRGLNLKHGSNGLSYVLYNENKTKKLAEFLLTADHDRTLDIMGLCSKRFKEGFKTLEEIFEYVTTSKYFGLNAFILADMPCKDRHRDQKRNTFIKFEEYCQANADKLPAASPHLPEDKRAFLYTLFPELEEQVNNALKHEAESVEIATKFNGHILMDMFPDLKANPKLLGKFISKFKEQYSRDYLLAAIAEDISDQCRVFKLEFDLDIDNFTIALKDKAIR